MILSHLLLLLPSGVRCRQNTNHPDLGFIITHTWHSSLRAPVSHYDSHLDFTFIISSPLCHSCFLTSYRRFAIWICLVPGFVVLVNVSLAPASRLTVPLLQCVCVFQLITTYPSKVDLFYELVRTAETTRYTTNSVK